MSHFFTHLYPNLDKLNFISEWLLDAIRQVEHSSVAVLHLTHLGDVQVGQPADSDSTQVKSVHHVLGAVHEVVKVGYGVQSCFDYVDLELRSFDEYGLGEEDIVKNLLIEVDSLKFW